MNTDTNNGLGSCLQKMRSKHERDCKTWPQFSVADLILNTSGSIRSHKANTNDDDSEENQHPVKRTTSVFLAKGSEKG